MGAGHQSHLNSWGWFAKKGEEGCLCCPRAWAASKWVLSLWILHPTERRGEDISVSNHCLCVLCLMDLGKVGMGNHGQQECFVTNSASEHSSTHFLMDLSLLFVAFFSASSNPEGPRCGSAF